MYASSDVVHGVPKAAHAGTLSNRPPRPDDAAMRLAVEDYLALRGGVPVGPSG